MLLEDSVAIVTGGSSGIGRGIATTFAAEGATVVVGDVTHDPVESRHWTSDSTPTDELIVDRGGTASFVETDVSDPSACRRLVSETVDRYGSLDVLVNNAGVHSEHYPETAESLDVDEWHRVIDVNLSGQFYCSKHATPALKAASGTILNLSSVQARIAAGCPAYAASKAATLNLTRDMAAAFGRDGVTVNAICPGTIRTPNLDYLSERELDALVDRVERGDGQIVLERLGEPEDVGHLAAFLASDRAEWITGEAVTVDGGYSIHLQ